MHPLVDPMFFRSIPFPGAIAAAVAAVLAMSGFLFLNTLYLQDVRGFGALQAGLLIAGAALILTHLTATTPVPVLVIAYLLFGMGFGNSLDVTVLGSVVTAHVAGPLNTGFAAASHIGWWILVRCGALLVLLGVLTSTKLAEASASRVATRFPAQASGELADPPPCAPASGGALVTAG